MLLEPGRELMHARIVREQVGGEGETEEVPVPREGTVVTS